MKRRPKQTVEQNVAARIQRNRDRIQDAVRDRQVEEVFQRLEKGAKVKGMILKKHVNVPAKCVPGHLWDGIDYDVTLIL